MVAKTVPEVKKIELRLASVPAGAKVVDNVDGELLGVTPLVLTRPRGGTLTVRLEKDGYQASTRTMPLDGDRAFELTLEQQKAKKKEHKTPRDRDPSDVGAGETVAACDGSAGRARIADPRIRFPGDRLRRGRAGLLRLPLRREVVVAHEDVADGEQPAARPAGVRQGPGSHRQGGRRPVRGGGVGRSGAAAAVRRSICRPASSRSSSSTRRCTSDRSCPRPIRRGESASWIAGAATCGGSSGSRCSRGRPATPATFATCTSCSRASRC